MRKSFKCFLEENKIAGGIIAAVLFSVYVFLFCYLSFSDFLSFSAIATDDGSHRAENYLSTEVVTIGITDEDLEIFDCSSGEIVAKVASHIAGNARSTVIALDVDPETMNEDAMEIVRKIRQDKAKIVEPGAVKFSELPMIDNLDMVRTGIIADQIEKNPNASYQGHTIKLLDQNGVLRHAVFDIANQDGNTIQSIPGLCYELYCDYKGLEPQKKISEQNTALVKLSSELEFTFTAEDILRGNNDGYRFDGKVVLIGYANNGLERGYVTSLDYDQYMYPAIFDANVVSNLIKGELVLSIPLPTQIILLIAAIVGIAIVVFSMGFFPAVCTCAAYELLVQLGAIMLYRIGYVAYLFPHLINGVLSFVLFSLVLFFNRNYKQKEELESLLGRYVDINIVKNLHSGKENSNKEAISDAKNEKAAIMFADIRRFTSISETIDATSLFNILNDYLSMMADSINKYGGTVDKFIGDCAMGYWLVKGAEYDPAYRACLAAEEIQRKAKEMSKKCLEKYGVKIEVGIGISYGDTVVGSVGSVNRTNYTIIGNTVNVASRLEGIAPAGKIYLSSEVIEKVGSKIECESIGKNVKLKNKEEPLEVYQLLKIAPISIRNRTEEASKAKIEKRQAESLALITMGIVGFFIDFVFSINNMRGLEINHVLYYPIGLAVIAGLFLIIVLSNFIREYNDSYIGNSSPHWLNTMVLSVISLHTQFPLYWLSCTLLERNTGVAIDIPGTWLAYLVNPVLLSVFWILFCPDNRMHKTDFLVAPAVTAGVIGFNYLICLRQGLNVLYENTFSISYQLQYTVVTIILNAAIVVGMHKVHQIVRSRKNSKREKERKALNIISEFFQTFDLGKHRKHSNAIQILLNLLVAILSIRVTVNSLRYGVIDVYSNPSMIGVIVTIMCVLSIIYNFQCIFRPDLADHNRWYKTVSFVKMLGCVINFLTILFLALAGEGLHIFFEQRWYADWTVFLLCPVICMLMWLKEKNDYEIVCCALCAVPYAAIIPLSKFAITSSELFKEYAYEVENFYSTGEMILIIVAEIVYAIGICYLGRIVAKIFSRNSNENKNVILSVCGNRRGIVGGEGNNKIYGTHSECYVIRTGDHGIVINAGSGLINASEKLYGCNEVDILLTSNEFCTVMGFLAVRDICPKARIKIYSPFDIGSIAARPYWPVNVVKGNYERVRVSKHIRLNNDYYAQFEYTNEEKTNCMVKISGLANICYTGKLGENNVDLFKWASRTGLLIYDSYQDPIKGCYCAIDCRASYLILSGFKPDATDEELKVIEKDIRNIIAEASIAKEGEDYIVYH